MVFYFTFLLLFSILIWPICLVVSLVVKLSQVGRISREMYPGVDTVMDIASSKERQGNTPTKKASVSITPNGKHKARLSTANVRARRTSIDNTIIAVVSVVLSAILSLVAISKL